MKRNLLILFFVCLGIVSNGQQYHFKNYSLEEGLSRSGVYFILQDNAGFLWIGTEGGGVCKFDGYDFKPYTRINGLASENVRVIFQDDRNILWFGTTEGLSYYDGEQFFNLSEEDGLADNFIRTITQDHEGNIWVGTDQGISIIDPDVKGISGKLKFNLSLPNKKVRSLLAQDSVIWIGTDGGLCKYSDDNIEVITIEDGLSNNRVLCLLEDSKGTLWIGTENGLNHITNGEINYWTSKDGLIYDRARSITEDAYGNIWIGTSHGISIFTGTGFQNISEDNGLSNERIRCLAIDDFDNVWIGTFFGGIMRFNHRDFIGYTSKEGLIGNQVSTIWQDNNGDIVIATYEGITKLNNTNGVLSFSGIPLNELGSMSTIHDEYQDFEGNHWLGTPNGLIILDENYNTIISQENTFLQDEITTIEYFKDKYWIGTTKGLVLISITDDFIDYEIEYLKKSDGLAGKSVSKILQDINGVIYVSFSDGSLSVFDNDQIINPVLPKQLFEILSMDLDDKQTLWMGTNGNGIYKGFYDQDKKTIDVRNISTSENLSSNYIFSILINGNEVWIGHEKGIDLITAINDSSFTIKTFGPERGFYGLQNNQNASFIDENGDLWFGTINGLFFLNNSELKANSKGHESILFIQNIGINGTSVNWRESEWTTETSGAFNLPTDLTLPYNKNNISFDFVALNYISPNSVKFSWKLEGFDEDWSTPTSKNYITYTNLEPGTYSFLLKSSDEYGEIQGKEISFSFNITKPFWSTWLFRFFAGFIILILVLAIMSWRTKQLRKKQKALEAIIEDRTAEIRTQNSELEIKQKEITDSIHYSKRIQMSILPSKEKTNAILDKYFIFFRPKDIISGDFYWVEESPSNPNLRFFAVADCTGHGVPGAMVSLIGTRALNASLLQHDKKICSEILDKTNDIVLESFTDSESGKIIKDGMDIGLCALDYGDKSKIKFQFSGAHNPVYIVRKLSSGNLTINDLEIEPIMELSDYALFEIKSDKQPIGYFEKRFSFNNFQGVLEKGDRIYLLSDGYADQFGGSKGKKFKYKTLKELILSFQDKEISEHYSVLKSSFYDWKGDIEQIDDVCIMGVEV